MSNKPKWTPGPWVVIIDDDGNPLSGRPSVVASDELDCVIIHWDGFVQTYWRSARGDGEIHANARLISAAPELYEALEEWLQTEDSPEAWIHCRQRARDALAKARGES